MYKQSSAIVFSTLKYNDYSIISNIFTLDYGKRAFIIKNTHTRKAKLKSMLFQPGTLLELTYQIKESRHLHYIDDAQLIYSPLQLDIGIKQGQLLFYMNTLSKIILEDSANPELFQSIKKNIIDLDLSPANPNKPIEFLVDLMRNIGIEPINNYNLQSCPYFNIQNSEFVQNFTSNSMVLNKEDSLLIHRSLNGNHTMHQLDTTKNITNILKYISYHTGQRLQLTELYPSL